MANVPSLKLSRAFGSQVVTPVALAVGAHTFEHKPEVRQVLYVRNDTANAGSVNLQGAAASSAYACAGSPVTTDLSSGYTVPIGAGELVAIPLASIRQVLQGVVSITVAGSAVEAFLTED